MSKVPAGNGKPDDKQHLRQELLRLIVKNETVRRGHTQTGEK